jgi:Ca-activated chloride channel family protein
MQALAQGSRGKHVDLNNSQATRDLVLRARELFEDIRDVRLTDLDMAVSGVTLADTQPPKLPDLFTGGQVIVVGRYSAPGQGQIQITGMEGAAPFARSFAIDAPELAEGNDVIKYVWASEKVRTVMASIANGADESQARSEVVAIGLAYRIQTPFTHYSGAYDAGSGVGEAGCSVAGSAGSTWIGIALAFGVRRRRRRRGTCQRVT